MLSRRDVLPQGGRVVKKAEMRKQGDFCVHATSPIALTRQREECATATLTATVSPLLKEIMRNLAGNRSKSRQTKDMWGCWIRCAKVKLARYTGDYGING